MGKKGNDKALAPSANREWDTWGAACGFTNWDAAASALGMTKCGIFLARKKPSIRLQTRLAMAAVLASMEPFDATGEFPIRYLTLAAHGQPFAARMANHLRRLARAIDDGAEVTRGGLWANKPLALAGDIELKEPERANG